MNEKNQTILPDHLAPLDDTGWAIWRWVGLRSAGFPIEQLRPLSSIESASAADLILASEQKMLEVRTKLSLALWQQGENKEGGRSSRVIRRLEQGHAPPIEILEKIPQQLADFQSARQALAAAREQFEHAFQTDIIRNIQALRQIAREPLFREALLWQNRHALHNGIDILLAKEPEHARTSKQRQREALITNYIQRYCTKNDTIGFFGPVGWAKILDQGPAISVQPGNNLLTTRTVYFEAWCLDALAETISKNTAYQPWLVPRLMPFVDIEGSKLHLPLTPPLPVSHAQAAVLGACDGQRTAKQIAHELVNRQVSGIRSVTDVYETLSALRTRRRIAWQLEVPIEHLHPEQALRQILVRIEDETLRKAALHSLDELENAKEAITRAAGNFEQLEQAMEQLDRAFTKLTNTSTTRHAGAFYAGRTLVYEDTQRDVHTEIGQHLIHTLGKPLSLLLKSARWFTYEATTLYRAAFKEIYTELAAGAHSSTVPLANFWLHAHTLLFDQKHPLLAQLKQKLQEKWAGILNIPHEGQRVVFQTENMRKQVEEAFAAPNYGWTSAYYHSPDIMIAATSPEAICKGEYQAVLGEIHAGANTLQSAFFGAQHPAPRELLQAIASDHPQARVILVPSRELGGATARMSNGFVLPHDWRFVFAHDSCALQSKQAVPMASLLVAREGDRLVVHTRDRRLQWEIVELLGEFMMLQTLHYFDILPGSRHSPRIAFDQLVIRRESWRFHPQECAFANIEREADRFLEVRRWQQAHQLPQRVFVKTAGERKPAFVDFDSLLSLDVFMRTLRRASQSHDAEEAIVLTEMLPDLHESWLLDKQKQHYTSEFRMVVVDRTTTHQ